MAHNAIHILRISAFGQCDQFSQLTGGSEACHSSILGCSVRTLAPKETILLGGSGGPYQELIHLLFTFSNTTLFFFRWILLTL